MSVENLFEYKAGEYQTVTRMLQYPPGSGVVYIRDPNRVKMAGYDIEIWDAETGGTQLVVDTDYTLGLVDADLSAIEGFPIYGGYQVINAAYQSIELFITAKIVGGYTTRPYRTTYTKVSADTTSNPSSMDDSILVDASAGPVTITLADGDYNNQLFTVACSGDYPVTISGTGFPTQAYYNIAASFMWFSTGWFRTGGATGEAANGNLSVGAVAWYAGTGAVPDDKLVCDGSTQTISNYTALYSAIGTTYGGDGITTFAVPDLQGITPGAYGTQDVGGNTKGDATAIGSIREDQMQQITGTIGNVGSGRQFSVTGTYSGAFSVADEDGNMMDGASATSGGTLTFDSADSPDARTGDYTRSAELVGRWLIQAYDTSYGVPVGYLYQQITGSDSPDDMSMFGTWTDVSASYPAITWATVWERTA